MLLALRYLPDWMLLVVQLLGLGLLFRGLGRTLLAILAVSATALGVAGKLGLTELSSGGPALLALLAGATLCASVLGLWRGRENLHLDRSFLTPEKLAHAVLWACSLCLWTYWLSDTDGLPSHHDGVVHSVFFLRVWEQGIFPLTRGFLPLAEIFGNESYQNYPAGAHLLANLLSLPHRIFLAPLGMPISNYLKASLILVCSAMPVLAMHWGLAIARPMLPKRPRAALAAAVISGVCALTYFRFPVVATDQGGWSRIVALGLIWLWAGEVLVIQPTREARRYGWLVLLGSFYLHPQAFIATSLVLGCVWIRDLRDARERLTWIGGSVAVVLLGWWVAPYTQSSSALAEIFPAQAASFEAVLGRVAFFIGQSIFGEPHARGFSLLSRRALGALGLVYFALRPRTAQAGWILIWLGILTFVSMMIFAPWPWLRVLGAPFYHQPDRIAETFYFPLALSWAMGASLLLRGAGARALTLGLILALIQGLGLKTVRAFGSLQEHFRHIGEVHRSPRFSVDGATIRELERTLDFRPTLLVAEPDVTDSWAFRVAPQFHVQSLFTFGECPIGGAEVGIHFEGHCEKRKTFYEQCKKSGKCPAIENWVTLLIQSRSPPPSPSQTPPRLNSLRKQLDDTAADCNLDSDLPTTRHGPVNSPPKHAVLTNPSFAFVQES